jgi:bacteriocin biosynthesis cyclodehydratase domain-containing protein
MTVARRRPRLALPFTILADGDTVRLVAGEDFRYTLTGPELGRWLPGLLAQFEGGEALERALGNLPDTLRAQAHELVERLFGERILVEASALEAHAARPAPLSIKGSGALWEKLRSAALCSEEILSDQLAIFCQDRLDYRAALQFNRECRERGVPWLWASSGAMERGYVGPMFLPDAGPCFACLLGHFQRLSPTPEIYAELIDHGERQGSIRPVPFPKEGIEILMQLVLRKVWLAQRPDSSPALYRLHVLEIDSLEVSSHPVLADPECPACAEVA